MSIHQSLKVATKLLRSRNVMNRAERLDRLKELGRWDEAKDSIFHLPKTKSALVKKIGKKKKKKEKEEGAEAAAAPGAAPAAGAAAGAKAPAAGAKAAAPAAKGAAPAAAAKPAGKK
jgi:small basic protein (TIGR04137 family)